MHRLRALLCPTTEKHLQPTTESGLKYLEIDIIPKLKCSHKPGLSGIGFLLVVSWQKDIKPLVIRYFRQNLGTVGSVR